MAYYRASDEIRCTSAYQFAEALSALIFHASSRWTPKDEGPVEAFAKALTRLLDETQGAPGVLEQVRDLVCREPKVS